MNPDDEDNKRGCLMLVMLVLSFPLMVVLKLVNSVKGAFKSKKSNKDTNQN